MVVTGLGFGSMFFLKEGSDTLISVLAVICGLGAGSGAVVAPSIQADVIDYDEYRSGKRKEVPISRRGILLLRVPRA